MLPPYRNYGYTTMYIFLSYILHTPTAQMTLNSEDILRHRGGIQENDLTKIINVDNFELCSKTKTKYYDTEGLHGFLKKHNNKLYSA